MKEKRRTPSSGQLIRQNEGKKVICCGRGSCRGPPYRALPEALLHHPETARASAELTVLIQAPVACRQASMGESEGAERIRNGIRAILGPC